MESTHDVVKAIAITVESSARWIRDLQRITRAAYALNNELPSKSPMIY